MKTLPSANRYNPSIFPPWQHGYMKPRKIKNLAKKLIAFARIVPLRYLPTPGTLEKWSGETLFDQQDKDRPGWPFFRMSPLRSTG